MTTGIHSDGRIAMLTKSFGILSVRRIRSHLALDMMGRAIAGTRNEAIDSFFTPAI